MRNHVWRNGPLASGQLRYGLRRAQIGFDPVTFDNVRARAAASGHSLSEEVSLLVERALAQEGDRHA